MFNPAVCITELIPVNQVVVVHVGRIRYMYGTPGRESTLRSLNLSSRAIERTLQECGLSSQVLLSLGYKKTKETFKQWLWNHALQTDTEILSYPAAY